MACEDCLGVGFVGLVVERICVWCRIMVAIFMGFGQAGGKRCGDAKSRHLGVAMQVAKGGLFS